MAEIIRLRKGLDIKLLGAPVKELTEVGMAQEYALCPADFTGVTPKPVVKEQQTVKAGEALFIDKNHPEVKFVSPVSGEVVAVNRGARRKVLSIVSSGSPSSCFRACPASDCRRRSRCSAARG